MRVFISSAIFLVLAISFANAQTTLSNITVNGQAYDITYRTGVDLTYETSIDDAPWWHSAKSFADAANEILFCIWIAIWWNNYVLYMDLTRLALLQNLILFSSFLAPYSPFLLKRNLWRRHQWM